MLRTLGTASRDALPTQEQWLQDAVLEPLLHSSDRARLGAGTQCTAGPTQKPHWIPQRTRPANRAGIGPGRAWLLWTPTGRDPRCVQLRAAPMQPRPRGWRGRAWPLEFLTCGSQGGRL